MVIASILAGVVLGFGFGLVPGLHPALVLALVVVYLPVSVAAPLVAAAAGTGLYTRHLAQVYSPSANDPAVSEPALRLTADGQGPLALRLMVLGTDLAAVVVGVLALAVLVMPTLPKLLDRALGPLGILVILVWALAVVAGSGKRVQTAVVLAAVAGFGYVVLHHPNLVGDRHQLAPAMVGMFTLVIAVTMLLEAKGALPKQEDPRPLELNPGLGLVGAVAGTATGFLAGLGAGSVASLFSPLVQAEDELSETAGYLLLATAAAVANDGMALLLVLVAGMGRSAEAAILGTVCDRPPVVVAALLLGVVFVTASVGRKLVTELEPWYREAISRLDARLPAGVVIVLGLAQIACLASPLTGLMLTGVGFGLGTAIKRLGLSQQVAFGALALPLVVQWAGAVPGINRVLF